MSGREKIFWLVVGFVFIVGALCFIPAHYEICEIAGKAAEKDCPRYQVVPFTIIKVGHFLDRAGATITALATIAIALFTLTLKNATDRLWETGQGQLESLKSSAALAAKDFEARLRPLLVVEFGAPDTVKSLWDGKNYRFIDDVPFRIKNVGGSAAILTGMYRTWDVCDARTMPKPIEPLSQAPPGIWKNNAAAIGGGQYSTSVKSLTVPLLKERRPIKDGDRVFFHGYFEYADLAGLEYVSGFCQLFDTWDTSMGFHIPWPEKNDEGAKYNYHRRLDDGV